MKNINVTFSGSPVNHTIEFDGPEIKKGQFILVETQRGLELVKASGHSHVCAEKKEQIDETKKSFEDSLNESEEEVITFVRLATEKDVETQKTNKEFADKIKQETKKLVRKYNLDMKVSEVSLTIDKNKASIYFTAENRVDFRDLVKELAGTFKTRIELRQIGARDETRIMGGFGPCGKPCCCKDFLNDFEHVSIKMAKNQNLSLNPTKISGLCGRLMCCLGYENEHYAEAGRIMPKVNSVVTTPNGRGTVVYNDLLKRSVQVRIGDDGSYEIKTFDLTEIKQFQKKD